MTKKAVYDDDAGKITDRKLAAHVLMRTERHDELTFVSAIMLTNCQSRRVWSDDVITRAPPI